MSLTRMHFELVAEVLRGESESISARVRAEGDDYRSEIERATLFRLATRFAEEFGAVNPRFDRVRFFVASGV